MHSSGDGLGLRCSCILSQLCIRNREQGGAVEGLNNNPSVGSLELGAIFPEGRVAVSDISTWMVLSFWLHHALAGTGSHLPSLVLFYLLQGPSTLFGFFLLFPFFSPLNPILPIENLQALICVYLLWLRKLLPTFAAELALGKLIQWTMLMCRYCFICLCLTSRHCFILSA